MHREDRKKPKFSSELPPSYSTINYWSKERVKSIFRYGKELKALADPEIEQVLGARAL